MRLKYRSSIHSGRLTALLALSAGVLFVSNADADSLDNLVCEAT